MDNIPEIKAGIVAVSRDCFPRELSEARLKKLADDCKKCKIAATACETLVEKESEVPAALAELASRGLNALVIYLGNFGPEGPVSMLAQRFSGPVMLCGAAEEDADNLIQGRGDAFCGLLSSVYNCNIRGVRVYLPDRPVGLPERVASEIEIFIPVARALVGLKKLKVFAFGPRPYDFVACNAPIKPLYDLGVEVMENSELDLFDIFQAAENHPDLEAVAEDMRLELAGKGGSTDRKLLLRLARLECALLDFYKNNKGACEYAVFANKCWPAFEKYFRCVPCFPNSRLATRGIPVACEADIYGAVSEYLCTAVTGKPPAILDINNTVPPQMYAKAGPAVKGWRPEELFMGFHCGNTSSKCMLGCTIKFQLIMHRLMEPGREPEITRGTLEGRIAPGPLTVFRLQGTADCRLDAYVAQGEVLDVDPQSFGCIGVIGVQELDRFYRHVLLGRAFPHHTAVAFDHAGRSLFEVAKLLGIKEVGYNRPKGERYPGENPFAN
ncbi:MAG TPA: fucose isomerase [Candidatus Glassbacteria bacterium]|nr:fucose isomerase [Candidatus Glassbacteria bacterium]